MIVDGFQVSVRFQPEAQGNSLYAQVYSHHDETVLGIARRQGMRRGVFEISSILQTFRSVFLALIDHTNLDHRQPVLHDASEDLGR